MDKITETKLVELISEITGYDVEDFAKTDKLINDLGFDSIMLMDLYSVIVPEDTKSSSVELLKKILKDDITVEGLMDLIEIGRAHV